jgi:hypothetical protein
VASPNDEPGVVVFLTSDTNAAEEERKDEIEGKEENG